LDLALEFVSKKISNQKMLLRKMRQKSVEFPKLDLIENLETLRGKEGAASKLYFSHWKRSDFLKNQNFKFKGRVKRPATDQINTLLSFSYSLLYSEIHTQIMIAGLDPYIGFLHDQNYGHSALASDVIEPFRALVDWFVLRIVNRKEIDAELDFELMDGGECKLSRSGYEKFFPKWSDFLRKELIQENRNLTQLIERDVRKLANFLMKDSDSFKAFVWKI
jgi:CRISPR-associated protein Cas1